MFLDLALNIERAGFAYLLLEESIYIGQNWRNSCDIFLRDGIFVPRQEPSVVASLMAAATTRLGIMLTLSTFAYHPYLTARIVGMLDQVSADRLRQCVKGSPLVAIEASPHCGSSIDFFGPRLRHAA